LEYTRRGCLLFGSSVRRTVPRGALSSGVQAQGFHRLLTGCRSFFEPGTKRLAEQGTAFCAVGGARKKRLTRLFPGEFITLDSSTSDYFNSLGSVAVRG
jgi:hypothetical protein